MDIVLNAHGETGQERDGWRREVGKGGRKRGEKVEKGGRGASPRCLSISSRPSATG